MRRPTGFLAVLRHELTGGWLAPVALAAVLAAMGARLAGGTIWLVDPLVVTAAWMLPVLVGGPLAARRLLAESAAGSFLATRPVSRLGALLAKGLATGADLLLVSAGGLVLLHGVERASPTIWLSGPSRSEQALLGLLAVGAITFGSFATLRSRWIAGTVAICLPLLALAAASRSWPLAGAIVGLPLAAALLRGCAWPGGDR